MLTFGLNRHLYSFGLSYPGYFFVEVPTDDTKYTIYKVYESNRFRAAELARRFIARGAKVYVAHPVPGESVTDYYMVLESSRRYIPTDNFNFIAVDLFYWKAEAAPNQFTAIEAYGFKAAENTRIFYAKESTDYAEVYRN